MSPQGVTQSILALALTAFASVAPVTDRHLSLVQLRNALENPATARPLVEARL